MDPLTYIVIAAFFAVISYAVQQDSVEDATANQRILQEDAQEFNKEEAATGRQWQEDFWKNNQSPAAMMRQFKELGASDTAALQSILGGSSSSVPSPSVGSSSASSAPFGFNSMADLFGGLKSSVVDYYKNQETKANAEKASAETAWIPRLNQNSIDSTISQLKLNWEKFGLDKRQFNEIAIPTLNNVINKTTAEISEIHQKVSNLEAEYNNLVAEYDKIKSETYRNYKEGELAGEQSYTQTFVRQNLFEDSELKRSQNVGLKYENELKRINSELSQYLGFDVTLSLDRNAYMMGMHSIKRGVDSWKDFDSRVSTRASDFFNGVKHTFDASVKTLNFKTIIGKGFKRSVDYVDSKLPSWSPAYQKWQRGRGQYLKALQDWINKNTMYGYDPNFVPKWRNKNERREYHEHGFVKH